MSISQLDIENALETATILVDERLALIQQRELDERDGAEEAKLRSTTKILSLLEEACVAEVALLVLNLKGLNPTLSFGEALISIVDDI